jgi:hypothetical protein
MDAEFVSLKLVCINYFLSGRLSDACLLQQELEERSSGTKKVLRPTKTPLASVLHGGGEEEGLPCIDDYIHISERWRITDQVSGIKGMWEDGVLGAGAYSKNRCRRKPGSDEFTTHVSVFEDSNKTLRLRRRSRSGLRSARLIPFASTVVDLGCVFIGPGLPREFRTISKWRC